MHWLNDVQPAQSIALLTSLVPRARRRGQWRAASHRGARRPRRRKRARALPGAHAARPSSGSARCPISAPRNLDFVKKSDCRRSRFPGPRARRLRPWRTAASPKPWTCSSPSRSPTTTPACACKPYPVSAAIRRKRRRDSEFGRRERPRPRSEASRAVLPAIDARRRRRPGPDPRLAKSQARPGSARNQA